MLLRYTGGRSHMKIQQDRSKVYVFNTENDFTLDLDMQAINYIFREMANRNEFEIIEKEEVKEVIVPKGKKNKPQEEE